MVWYHFCIKIISFQIDLRSERDGFEMTALPFYTNQRREGRRGWRRWIKHDGFLCRTNPDLDNKLENLAKRLDLDGSSPCRRISHV